MNPRLSIITVNFNNLEGLKKTLSSVFEQTLKDFEYIIIDGNSTDGGQELVQSIKQQVSHAISENDLGIYNAMNKGIRIAKGDYLLFLNSGDCLANERVLEQIQFELDGETGIYYGDILFETKLGQQYIQFPDRLTFDFFVTNNLSHQASFIKRSLFDEFFFYNETFRIVSDWEFFVYAICKSNVSYKHLDITTTIYDGTGISSDPTNRILDLQERRTVMEQHFPAFIDDYVQIAQLKEKRVQQFFRIKESRLGWKILKVFIKLIYAFLPRKL